MHSHRQPEPSGHTTADPERGVTVTELRASGGGSLAYQHERATIARHYGPDFDPEVDVEGWGGG